MIDKGKYYQWYEKGHFEHLTRAWKENTVSGTLTCREDGIKVACVGGESNLVKDLKIRKLTPRECFRLQGVKDEDIDKILKHQSNASAYHLAGDSIVIDVLKYIFLQMV